MRETLDVLTRGENLDQHPVLIMTPNSTVSLKDLKS